MSTQEQKMIEHSDETAYFGRLTAGVTHEMSNVLAIIGESVGLMEDLLELSGDFPHRERMAGKLTAIRQQLSRGQRLCFWLNGFAHTPDNRPDSIDPAVLTAQVVGLAARPARLARVALSMGDAVGSRICADPVALHRALCMTLEDVWSQLPADAQLRVDCGPGALGFAWRMSVTLPVGAHRESLATPGGDVAQALDLAGIKTATAIGNDSGLCLNLWTLSDGG